MMPTNDRTDRSAAPAAKTALAKAERARRLLYPDARPSSLRRYRAASLTRSWSHLGR